MPADRVGARDNPVQVGNSAGVRSRSRYQGGNGTSLSAMRWPSPLHVLPAAILLARNRRPLSLAGDRMTTVLDSYDLAAAERWLCTAALEATGGIVPAAQWLGVTRHALKRRSIKHPIEWPPREA